MASPSEPSTPETRVKAQSRVSHLTRGVVLAATGLTALIGVVVAKEHPGSSSAPEESGNSSSTSTGSNSGSSGSGSGSQHRQLRFRLDLRHHDHDDVGWVELLERQRRFVGQLELERVGAHVHLQPAHRDVGGHVVTATDISEPALTARSFRAIGTTATVVVQDPALAGAAECVLARQLEEIDLACSRFRDDSELAMLHAGAGRTVPVGALLFEALEVACDVARRTGGAVDPTVGNALAALGYDADLDEVRRRPPAPPAALGRVVGYQHVQLHPRTRSVRIPRGVLLDLGSTAKALAADRAAAPHRRRRRGRGAGEPRW